MARHRSRYRASKFVVPLLAIFVVATTVAGLVGPSFPWRPWWDTDGDGRVDIELLLAQGREKAAKQAWGSADGLSAQSDSRDGNWGLPVSEQSKYAKGDGAADRPSNKAKVIDVQQARTGYDAKSSAELPDQRGRNERTYRNTDGTHTTEFSPTPVNYRKPDGTWAPIDSALDPEPGRGWRNRADQVGVHLAAVASSDELVRVRLDDQHEFAYGLKDARAVRGHLDGRTVVYPGVIDNVDLAIESLVGGAKETLILKDRTAARSWTFGLRLKGLSAKLVDGTVVLADATGAGRAQIPPGFMTDSAPATDTRGPVTSHGVRYELVDSGQSLKVTLDEAWLDDPARVYPVLVDPTVLMLNGTSTMYMTGTTRVNNPSTLHVGWDGSARYTSYATFPDLVSRLGNHTIFGASLQVVNFQANTCRPTGLTVSPVSESWATGVTGPRLGAPIASPSFSHGYIRDGQSQSACPTAAELIDLGVGGQQLVQGWVNGAANYGLAFRAADESATSGYKKLTGSSTLNPPRLFVTHTPYNAKYVIEQPVPEPPVTQVQDGKVKIKVTNLGVAAWNPTEHFLAYRRFNAATNALVETRVNAATLPGVVERGGEVLLEATIGKIPEDGSYLLDFTMRHNDKYFTDEQIAPARIGLEVFNVPPFVTGQYPPSGHSAETLHPQLWAKGIDHEGDPFDYLFEVCEKDALGNYVNCFNSGRQAEVYWTVPAGKLRWDRIYYWRTTLWDQDPSPSIPYSALIMSVPQPEVTSRLGNAPYTGNGLGFDPMAGNYTTAAVDLSVAAVGPELNIVRTYNSLDPRPNLAFGSGWSSAYDMRVVPDEDGSGNVIVTYPDGQQVRFGRNPDGSYSPPAGRFATLTPIAETEGGGWKLVDKDRTVYTFRFDGVLRFIQDSAGRLAELIYNTTGRLWKAVSRTSNRTLYFSWNSGGHVQDVTTDPVGGAPLTWIYRYDGNRLLEACDPTAQCTRYQYDPGSHYRSVVLDSRPHSYWRLNETSGAEAASQVSVKLGKDKAFYRGFATPNFNKVGAIEGTLDSAAELNGTGYVELPKSVVSPHRDMSIELWFKTSSAGPLVSYQDKAIGQIPTKGMPVLYVGSDGKLRGQFRNGRVEPITSSTVVNDGSWHHVVLSGSLATQTLYLDSAKVGSSEGVIDHPSMEFAQVGQAYTVGAFPAIASQRTTLAGVVDEVAVYTRPLGISQVRTHYLARMPGDQIKKVTLPSMRVAAEITYDTANDRMSEYVDGNGGRWKLGVPYVAGTETNIIRSVRIVDPGGRPRFYDFDGLKGRILRQVTPMGMGPRPEDLVGRDCETNADGLVECSGLVISLGTRLYDYDKSGFQTTVTDENGDKATLEHDSRGNLISKKTCRAVDVCQTKFYEYQPPTADVTDPMTDKLVATRDARSSGRTDNTYRTQLEYTSFGDLAKQTAPDGGSTFITYTDGSTDAIGGGKEPARLLKATTDPRGVTTAYFYRGNGDLAETRSPSGLRKAFTYDEIGRLITETEYSDAQPSGVKTTYRYDQLSRIVEVNYPATTNKVTGASKSLRELTTFDADGNVTRVESVDSTNSAPTRVTHATYDGFGRKIKQASPTGAESAFGYDNFGNLTWTVDPDGVKTAYAYTARNKVAHTRIVGWNALSVTPGGNVDPTAPTRDLILQAYQYDHAGRLIIQADAMGRQTKFKYLGDGLVDHIKVKADAKSETPELLVQRNTYDAAGNLIHRVGPGDKVVTHEIDAVGRLAATTDEPGTLRRRTAYSYDLSGNVTKVTRTGAFSNAGPYTAAFGQVVDFEYDLAGRQIKESLQGANGPVITKTSYDQRDLVTKVVAPRGNVAGAIAADHTTEYRYDELGRAVEVVSPPVLTEQNGAAPTVSRPSVATGFDVFGQPTESRDLAGSVRRTIYDDEGRAVKVEGPAYQAPGTTTPTVSTATAEYDSLGRVIKSVDALGAVTHAYYDQLGRVVEKRDPNPADRTQPGGSWRYSYTDTGALLSTTDPSGGETRQTYDQFDRPITSTVIELRPAVAAFETKMAYDTAGNLATVTSPKGEITRFGHDTLGQRTSVTDPAGVATQFGYDSFGNQVYTRDAQGRAEYTKLDQAGNATIGVTLNPAGQIIAKRTFTYDIAGNQLTASDAMGKLTRTTFDAAGRLTQLTEPVTDTQSITTTFGYDSAGRKTRVTDGRGNPTIYTYNSLGKPESVIEPATDAHPALSDRTWTASYDAAGLLTNVSNPGGVSRARTYDGLGRVIKETGTGAAVTPDRVIEYDPIGRATKISAPGGDNIFEYNNRGLLTSAVGPSGNATFAYDEQGRLSSRVDAAGTTAFGYTAGRLSSVQNAAAGVGIGYSYTAAGQLDKADYGLGRVRQYAYDDFGRETADVTKNASGATVASVAYAYDVNDRLIKKTTTGTAGAGEQTFTYDQSGRTTSWTSGGATTQYTWDASGNRTRNGAKTASYDQRNRLLSDGDSTYTYTARGTMASRTTAGSTENYTFDAFDRLTSAGTIGYSYDGLDRPVTRGTQAFEYAGKEIDAVSDGNTTYGRGASGEALFLTKGAEKRVLLSDRHGDVFAGFDPATPLTTMPDSTAYDPWGKETASTGTKRNIGFQGDWTDSDTGLINMGARWYSPATGSFTSRDAVTHGAPGASGFNRYGYAGGSPSNATDPDGRCLTFIHHRQIPTPWSVAASCVEVFLTGTPAQGGCAVEMYQPNGQPCPGYAKFLQDQRAYFDHRDGERDSYRPSGPGPRPLPGTRPGNKPVGPSHRPVHGPSAWDITDAARDAAELLAKSVPIVLNVGAQFATPIVSTAANLPARLVIHLVEHVQDVTDVIRKIQDEMLDEESPVVDVVAEEEPSSSDSGPWRNDDDDDDDFCGDRGMEENTPIYGPMEPVNYPGRYVGRPRSGATRATTAMVCMSTINPVDRKTPLEPAGYVDGAGMHKGHLVAHMFHGSNKRDNMVPLYVNANTPEMLYVENQVKYRVDTLEEKMFYQVTPIYRDGNDPVPVAMDILATSDSGWTCHVQVINEPVRTGKRASC